MALWSLRRTHPTEKRATRAIDVVGQTERYEIKLDWSFGTVAGSYLDRPKANRNAITLGWNEHLTEIEIRGRLCACPFA